MPGISQRRFYSTIRGPSADALDLLGPHSASILSAWHREVHALGLHPNDLLIGTPFDFTAFADALRASTYPSLRQHIQEYGKALARQGILLDHAVSALNRLFEISLSRLIRDAPERATPILALARLHAFLGLLAVSGY